MWNNSVHRTHTKNLKYPDLIKNFETKNITFLHAQNLTIRKMTMKEKGSLLFTVSVENKL